MGKRILVVDDDQTLRSLIREFLEEATYEVDTATNGIDALAQLHHQQGMYDVIVLDLAMPHLNGVQFLRVVQQQGLALLHSIIALSAEEEALQQVADIGIYTIMKKPFDLDVLLILVEQAMCWR